MSLLKKHAEEAEPYLRNYRRVQVRGREVRFWVRADSPHIRWNEVVPVDEETEQ